MDTMSEAGVVIVGAGQGGFQLAASLRDEGWRGPVILVGEEPGLPYQRPPLSKAFITGKSDAQQLMLRPEAFYAEKGIALRLAQRVCGIDRAAQRVSLEGGESVSYAHLALATGARARMPAIVGIGLAGVQALRSMADAQALRAALGAARRVVVIGAGFIGLEVAAAARALGVEVDVLEFTSRALERSVCAPTALWLTQALQAAGVGFGFNTTAVAIEGEGGRATGVRTGDGLVYAADLVVVGIGVVPNDALAAAAGLAVDNGIRVDEFLRTADPLISAIGDCASFPPETGAPAWRLESVQNAVDHARCVAARIAGRAAPYAKIPWFWSDQGANRLQIAGVAQALDSAVVRGDPASGKFSVFRFRGKQLTAVESINQAGDHMVARKLLAQPCRLSAAQAADPLFKLSDALPAP